MPAKMIHEAWTGDAGATYFITVDGKLGCELREVMIEKGRDKPSTQSQGADDTWPHKSSVCSSSDHRGIQPVTANFVPGPGGSSGQDCLLWRSSATRLNGNDGRIADAQAKRLPDEAALGRYGYLSIGDP